MLDLRAAFDSDDVPQKNIALRRASDRIADLEAALRKISDPIAWLTSELQPGETLDGDRAYALSINPHWLRETAAKAISADTAKE